MYMCLKCGSRDGVSTNDGEQFWYFRNVQYGRLGPFCCPECATTYRFPDEPEKFSLKEWERLRFYREMAKDPASPFGV